MPIHILTTAVNNTYPASIITQDKVVENEDGTTPPEPTSSQSVLDNEDEISSTDNHLDDSDDLLLDTEMPTLKLITYKDFTISQTISTETLLIAQSIVQTSMQHICE